MAELDFPSLQVKLDCYEGPLSLLLTLVRKNKLSIWDVPISEIVDRFLYYVDLVKEMNLKVAEEFIEIASLLIVLKSRMLLFPDEEKKEEEVLLERIYEYERAKRFASSLERLPHLHRDIFVRQNYSVEEDKGFDLYVLMRTFFELMGRKEERFIEIKKIRPTLEERLSYIEERLRKIGAFVFDTGENGNLSEKVATIISMLEIVKRRVAIIVQHRPFGRIILKRREVK
jgi:segregation and condensation protein A